MADIKFGTDGWRGVIADDFTFHNVRRVGNAIAAYVHKNEDASKGLGVGYDTRFASDRAAKIMAETLAAAGIPVLLADSFVPTPAVSLAVRNRSMAGGVVITSSHNPWSWNGVKFKATYGGSANPAIIKAIEAELDGAEPRGKSAPVEMVDLKKPYVEAITRFADLDRIARAGLKFAIDSMHGSGQGILAGIFRAHGIEHVEIRGNVDPMFGGVNPEPIEPHVAMLQETVVREGCHGGLANDGDADRIGAVDEHGNFVDSHKCFSILLWWLLERKQWPGEVVRAFNTTRMLDRIARKHSRKLHETGVGFKFICDLMLEREILVGGEESGGIGIPRHLPERDGILNALLLAQVMAEEGTTLGQLVAGLQREFGEHYYGRVDMHIPVPHKEAAMRAAHDGCPRVGRFPVVRTETVDGVKFFLDAKGPENGAEAWILFRASGTEPLLRVYAEAASPALVKEILKSGEAFVTSCRPTGTVRV